MRIRASAWMPAAIPSILIIFMELVSNYRVAHRLSFVVSKAISNSGRMKLGYGPFEAVAPVLVAAEHVKAREARAEQHVSPRLGRRRTPGMPRQAPGRSRR